MAALFHPRRPEDWSMPALQDAITYANDHQDESLDRLKDLLRIPSISTLPENRGDMQRAADWLVDRLRALGFDQVQILPTDRHPVVFGQSLAAGEGAPTVLVYGHYDVQPADPLDLWESPPFEPTVRGENLYARGAADMKGQVVAHLQAVEAMVESGDLPINIKYMLEGEEEIGSPDLQPFIQQHRDLLSADISLNADSGILAADTPAITYALRGLAYFEIRLQGAQGDLHSGRYGGVVDNPAQVLAHLLDGMKDRQGRVLLPGFYDKVRPLSDDEREDLARLPMDDSWWKEQAGVRELFGEPGFTPTERASARPTLDINGLLSGFTGEGSKTVLPARAMAKLSMRLVPDQSTDRMEEIVTAYLEENVPSTMTWELINHASSPPGIMERDSKAVTAASRAFEQVWGKQPLFAREGGTVPVVGYIKDDLGLDSLMLGFGLPDANLHAPNEKQHLPSFFRGIETYIRFSHELAKA
jgi:acetylornithine deacetylase/succinyl-diaminopimelate desuccinylase-like protein